MSFTPTTLKAPSSMITYVPSPTFNIRSLLSDFSSLDPAFTSTILRSLSVSSRARAIQRKEARDLLVYFLVALVLAIPTFVISIVGMVLMPEESKFRMFWMKKVWGGAGRGTIVLWVLATVVQFGVGT